MMDKQAVIREGLTPPEEPAKAGEKTASACKLENHATTRLQDVAEKKIISCGRTVGKSCCAKHPQ